MKLSDIKYILRLKPFDTNTEQGRTDERYRRAMLSIIANIISKTMSILLMVFSVSMTVPYLGAERFGVWMTIASFASMLTFLDLGVGNALTNRVAYAATYSDSSYLQRVITGGLGFLFLLGIGMGALLSVIASMLPWTSIIKVNNYQLHDEIRYSCILFALLFGLNIFTTGIQRIFTGLQQSYTGHWVAGCGSAIAILLLWLSSSQEADIPILLLVTLGCQSITSLSLVIFLIKRDLFSFSNILPLISIEQSDLLRVGRLFFILQIGTMVGWGADSLIISSTLGATQVAAYSITQRLFQFITQPLAIINAPLWGAYADANARNDRIFIKYTVRNSTMLTASTALIASILIFTSSHYIIDVWTGGRIVVSPLLIAVFGCWTVCEATGNAFAMFLNGCNVVRQQVITSILLSIIALPIKILFVKEYGVSAMIASYAFIYLLIHFGMYGILFRDRLIEIYK